MNREILFRGKRKNNNEWVYGYLVFSEDYIFDYSERIDIPYVIPIGNFNLKDYRDYRVDENTIGQYTGLTDKNGKKIFEGDILGNKNEKYKFIVKYNHHRMGFSLFPTNDTFPCDDMSVNVERKLPYEVIGNIYESKINK